MFITAVHNMEGTVALKHALVARGILDHATVRSPLLPLSDGAEQEIHDAMRQAGIGKVGFNPKPLLKFHSGWHIRQPFSCTLPEAKHRACLLKTIIKSMQTVVNR